MPPWKCLLFQTVWHGTRYGQGRKLIRRVEELRITKGRSLLDCLLSDSLSVEYYIPLVGRTIL